VLWVGIEKGAKTTRAEIMKKYKKDYTKTAEKMVKQLVKFAGK
jgi:hypothetical protein